MVNTWSPDQALQFWIVIGLGFNHRPLLVLLQQILLRGHLGDGEVVCSFFFWVVLVFSFGGGVIISLSSLPFTFKIIIIWINNWLRIITVTSADFGIPGESIACLPSTLSERFEFNFNYSLSYFFFYKFFIYSIFHPVTRESISLIRDIELVL